MVGYGKRSRIKVGNGNKKKLKTEYILLFLTNVKFEHNFQFSYFKTMSTW